MDTGKQKIQLFNSNEILMQIVVKSYFTLWNNSCKQLFEVMACNPFQPNHLFVHVPRKFSAPVADLIPVKQDCRQIVATEIMIHCCKHNPEPWMASKICYCSENLICDHTITERRNSTWLKRPGSNHFHPMKKISIFIISDFFWSKSFSHLHSTENLRGIQKNPIWTKPPNF